MNGDPADEAIGYLNSLNRKLKESYPLDGRDAAVRRQYGMTQICINTEGCTAGRTGSCLFCNYPRGRGTDPGRASAAVKEALRTRGPDDRSVLVGASGSILDPSEVSDDVLDAVLDSLSGLKGQRIILESRLETVTDSALRRISERLSGNTVCIEFGLESADPWILKYCLNKHLDLEKVKDAVRRIHGFGFMVTANILVGIPFLTPAEQVFAAAESVRWAMDAGIDDVVLFPVSVRRSTVLDELYSIGAYEPPGCDALVSVLQSIDPSLLDRVSLSWADPSQVDDPVIRVHPRADDPAVYRFFSDFMNEPSSEGRSRILSDYVQGRDMLFPSDGVESESALKKLIMAASELRKRFGDMYQTE